jgi:hypothetical protein
MKFDDFSSAIATVVNTATGLGDSREEKRKRILKLKTSSLLLWLLKLNGTLQRRGKQTPKVRG